MPMMPSLFHRAALIFVCLLLLASPTVIAGGGPTGVVVVYDPNDPRSVTIANEYQQVRGIPERNMVPYAFPTTFSRTTAWDFVYSLRATLNARGLEPQLQCLALAGVTPLGGISGGDTLSLHSFLYVSPNFSEANFRGPQKQNAYASPMAFQGPAPAGTVAITAATDFNGQRYWPVSSIGFPGKSGNSPREILSFIARAKSHDGAKPTGGTIYWPLNEDVRSQTREQQIYEVKDVWKARGIRYSVTKDRWVSDRPDIQGGVVGTEQFTDAGNTYLPGAWVDHLTSSGGAVDTFDYAFRGQTQCSEWLRAGADGSSGTMTEPSARPQKFPHANIHTHLRAGASLAEAFWQSIQHPAEIICLGDPLLQTFADFPNVSISSPADGATVSGNVLIAATAAPTGGKTLESNLDLFIDGRRIAIGQAGETISATRTVGGFTVNTATLGDGWHEVRVVAYNNDSVRTQNEAVRTIRVSNAGQSLVLNGPATVNPDGNATFTVTPVGLGDLTSLTLQANGRTLATLPTSGGSANISGTLAPLANEWSVYAVGTRSNGQQVWSAPFTTTVVWPAQAAATGFTPGGAMADVRFFNSTNGTGFNWDTTTPNVVTTFPGNATSGLYITPTNVPGISLNGTTASTLKPGYELKCWFYAPTDDWYEVDYGFEAWNANITTSCAVDGTPMVERNAVYGPRHLARGWHELRLRFTVLNSNWQFLQILLRGGSSQDFAILARATTANAGTGVAASTPTILSITPSASPVITANVTLTANATIGGGTPAELANLTYHWSQVSGPSPVTFSTNGAANTPATRVTFTQTGNYVIGLRVAGATNSAFTTVPVSVQAAAPSMVLSTNGYTNAPRGMPLDVYAYSTDQFGRRIEITGANTNLPTVQWSTTDPNGAFTNIGANGETAQFRSLSALSSNTTYKITATGVNGRTGTVTSGNITIVTNAPSSPSVLVSQSPGTGLLTFLGTVSDPEWIQWDGVGLSYPNLWLSCHWSVVAAPPGQTLTLGTDGFMTITGQAGFLGADGVTTNTGTASGPGKYTVQFDVTDQVGQVSSTTVSFLVDAGGRMLTVPSPGNKTLHVGQTLSLSLSFPHGELAFQWQTRSNSGASWQDIAGSTATEGGYDLAKLNYGPVTAGDNGRQFRLLVTSPGGTLMGPPGTITVANPVGGTIRIADVIRSGDDFKLVPENAGSATVTVSRMGQSTGAVSVEWALIDYAATPGVDYLAPNGNATGPYNGTLTWADGDTSDRVMTMPIVNDTLADEFDELFSFEIFNPVGAAIGAPGNFFNRESFLCNIVDDDDAGQPGLDKESFSVTENAGAITIPVHRLYSFKGPLTVNYATQVGSRLGGGDFTTVTGDSAAAGDDFTTVTGELTWADGETADKQIVVPILSDNLVEGDETFTVTLTDSNMTLLDDCKVTIKDAPYQQWQKTWWAASMPAVPAFKDYATCVGSFNPLFLFRFSEAAGTSVYGVNAAGTTVASGTLTKNGTGGNYTLAQAGPRPLLWPGLESGNTALSFTTSNTVTSTPPRFSTGASANCSAANGLGSNLGNGFTFSMFVKTTVTDREMILLGGRGNSSSPTNVFLSLNRAANDAPTCVPHTVRIYLRSEGVGGGTLDYSVALQNLPTGSICDGQWHHLAVTVPMFDQLNTDCARFFFDGVEYAALDVRGGESITSTATFSDFDRFRIGADGSAAPTTFFNGMLDEVAFIPRVLTAAEIANLVASRPPSTPPAHTADTGNPSGDGFPNLMKYALGLNPLTKASGADLPSIQPKTNNTVDFNFTRMRDATDIIYRVERRWDLMSGSWTEVYNSSGDPFGTTDPSITESLNFYLQGNPKAFFRLKITRP